MASAGSEHLVHPPRAIGPGWFQRYHTTFVRPTANIFCEAAQSWVPMSPDMEQHARYDGWLPTPT